jgi:uncharacterized lipoprotein YddW (UPF0748 family)
MAKFKSVESFIHVLKQTDKPEEELTHTDIWARSGVLSEIAMASSWMQRTFKTEWVKRSDPITRTKLKKRIKLIRTLKALFANNSNRSYDFCSNNPEWND